MSDGPKTIDDLLALEASTGERFEIVNGEFISMDNPPRHSPGSTQVSATIARFAYFLVEYAESHQEFEVFDGNLEFALPGGTRRAAVSAIRPWR